MKGEIMTVLKIGLVIAAIAFLGFAFFKLAQFFCAEWKRIEKDKEELRRLAGLRVRARAGN
jgi:hypothetical protein